MAALGEEAQAESGLRQCALWRLTDRHREQRRRGIQITRDLGVDAPPYQYVGRVRIDARGAGGLLLRVAESAACNRQQGQAAVGPKRKIGGESSRGRVRQAE